MEDSKYTMEYDTPTLLAPKYRYAIARGISDNVEELDNVGGSGNVSGGL